MISRYRVGKFLPLCYFYSNTPASSTSSLSTFTVVVKCAAGATVGFKVSAFSNSYTGPVFKVNGTSYVLNDTFSITDAGTGSLTLTIIVGWAAPPPTGNGINVYLSIVSVNAGKLGSPLLQGEDKIV